MKLKAESSRNGHKRDTKTGFIDLFSLWSFKVDRHTHTHTHTHMHIHTKSMSQLLFTWNEVIVSSTVIKQGFKM